MKAFAQRIRIGMVGGGPGGNIAVAHRAGLRLDGRYDLVAGAFSRSAEKSHAMGAELGIDSTRVYANHDEMAVAEADRADGIEAVAIVTPNANHFPAAKAFLEQGIHVICDKPLADNFDHGVELYQLARSKQLIFALTHNYACYSMIRQAAQMVADGDLGTLRSIQGEFASSWGAGAAEDDAVSKQIAWRTDPAQAGKAVVLSDLGTHIHHLARFVTDLEIEALSADLTTLVPGRRVYDNAQIALRFDNDVRGAFWVTMVATGAEHGLRIRVVGSAATLEWRHEDPHHLHLSWPGGRHEILAQGGPGLKQESRRLDRVPGGHPEGFFASFANLYSDVAEVIAAARSGGEPVAQRFGFPTAYDGVLGLQFVDCACASATADGKWVTIEPLDI